MISKRDVAKLLAMAAAYDQRTVGAADVDAWHQVAVAGRWLGSHAARALIEHYTAQTDRIMPAHITRTLRQRREEFKATYVHRPCPPAIKGQAEIQWERDQVASHIAACMDRWATGERGDQ